MVKTQFSGQLVFITGGSSGIGLALAKQLSALGAHIHILARRPQQLQEALEQIRSARVNEGQNFGVISCDLADRFQLEAALAKFQQEVGTPDLLINAAGYSYPALILDTPADIFYHQMDVNYFGTVNTVRAFLPAIIERNTGHIVNISSVAGFLTGYGFGAYSGSKFAVRAFTEVLRSELKTTKVKVSICFPPDTDTPGLAEENKIKPEVLRLATQAGGLAQPEEVADSIIKGILHNRFNIVTGFETNIFFILANTLGLLFSPGIIPDLFLNAAWKKIARREKENAKRQKTG